MSKQVYTVDSEELSRFGYAVGDQVSWNKNIPTADDGNAFFVSQLAHIESRVYETKYPGINFSELVTPTANAPEWANSVDYRSYDGVTMGKFITGSADDLPRVAMSAQIHSVPIGYAGNEAEWTLDELRKSQHLGMPIDIALLSLSRRGAEEHMQRVAYYGDADRKMNGLVNNPNVTVQNGTIDWTAAGTEPLDIVQEVNRIISSVWTNSKGVHRPNTVVLPSSLFARIATTYASAQYPDKSILELIKEKNVYTAETGQPLKIVGRFQLEGAELAKHGITAPKGRILVYENTTENLLMEIPMPWRTVAPQPRGLKVAVPAEYKFSGVEWRYPLSATYCDLI